MLKYFDLNHNSFVHIQQLKAHFTEAEQDYLEVNYVLMIRYFNNLFSSYKMAVANAELSNSSPT